MIDSISVRSYRDVALLPAALELAGFILKDRGSLDEPMSSIVQGGGKRRFLGEWIGVKLMALTLGDLEFLKQLWVSVLVGAMFAN